MKKIIVFLLTSSLFFISCKEKISLETNQISESGLEATIKYPVYKKYPEVTERARKTIDEDFNEYKSINVNPDSPYTMTYRTEIEDVSNGSFVNLNIRKFIFAGPTIEDEYIISIVYNKKTKTFETIESLTGLTYEEYSKLCQEEIFNQLDDISENDAEFIKDWIKSGTQNMPIYWTAYNADKKYVTIQFSPGQVLSNWYGTRSVKLERKRK